MLSLCANFAMTVGVKRAVILLITEPRSFGENGTAVGFLLSSGPVPLQAASHPYPAAKSDATSAQGGALLRTLNPSPLPRSGSVSSSSPDAVCLARFWSLSGPTFWPLFDHFLTCFWPLFGPLLGPLFGQLFGSLFGHFLTTFWPLFGHFLATFWITFWLLFGHFWITWKIIEFWGIRGGGPTRPKIKYFLIGKLRAGAVSSLHQIC